MIDMLDDTLHEVYDYAQSSRGFIICKYTRVERRWGCLGHVGDCQSVHSTPDLGEEALV